MPIVGDSSIADAIDIRGDEMHCLAFALHAIERTGEVQVRDHAIARDDHRLDISANVGHGCVKDLRSGERSRDALRPAGGATCDP